MKMMSKRVDYRREFHISRESRDLYQFDQTLFAFNGNVIFADFHAARLFAKKMNDRRDLVNFPERAVRAGQINAMGLIDEILHYVFGLYQQQANSNVLAELMKWLEEQIGAEEVARTIQQFTDAFPPITVYKREETVEGYLEGETNGTPHTLIALEELLLLWFANSNPAFHPYKELFNDSDLEKRTAYRKITQELHSFFEKQPKFGPDNENLIDMLQSPAVQEPHSLTGQLEYIRKKWGALLGKYLLRLLSSLDLIREEERMFFGVGAGPARVYDFRAWGLGEELERFSPDKDWMPRLVLMAKNIHVWLDQLSKKYGAALSRLDQIPDEELDTLARWGINGLWLIGLWERSEASKRIKQLTGNPEAISSAYSLYDYEIAQTLGGVPAYQYLRDRARQKGIRLAADMVPNHTGIYSKWIIEHPDWYLSLDQPPFPSYSFHGPDLSPDPNVGIFVEDHYYERSDAAVVFKRVDRQTGREQYIYHGNDGTSMPWNDTAQLNYLKAEVREAVIQTMLKVARQFSVIRFDAAMTLAKKHIQRLWFPEPGSGGAIPSRAEHGMTREQFNEAMPREFWREVVDRIAQEVPDTLLLAEAFWLMEGYFVRTLGMHRVYNSAFMNMLRDEKNAEYRLVIKNTIEFDPEILKRYVNFMNNPDEETAVEQFGKGGKYFGVCVLMCTMPGLPMFGHGQIEGFTEKYGMEYKRAYWDEQPDQDLISRHEREIFPLLHQRYLFANVENFLLYDFFTPDGYVNEDVYAYSNRFGEKQTLILYQNAWAETQGWIKKSAAYMRKEGDERKLDQQSLGEGLDLPNQQDHFMLFRDHISGLEYIRNCQQVHQEGLYFELGAYQYQVFLDFRIVQDNEWRQYAQLEEYLAGRGVPDINLVLKEIILQPVLQPFKELVNAGMFRWIIDDALLREMVEEKKSDQTPTINPEVISQTEEKLHALLRAIKEFTGGEGDAERVADEIIEKLKTAFILRHNFPQSRSRKLKAAERIVQTTLNHHRQAWGQLLSYLFTHRTGKIVHEDQFPELSRSWLDEWTLHKILSQSLQDLGMDDHTTWRSVALLKILISTQKERFNRDAPKKKRAHQTLIQWLSHEEIQLFLNTNRYQNVLYFGKEAFDELVKWMFTMEVLACIESNTNAPEKQAQEIIEVYDILHRIREAEEKSGYSVEALLEASQS